MSSISQHRSSSVKSLKSSSILQNHKKLTLVSTKPFEINPQHIVFKNIQSEKDYQVKVEIRNLTKKPQRIRFEKFNNKRFSFQNVLQGQIAAGLTIFVIVKYQCQSETPQSQVLRIFSSDGFSQQLQINTYPKQSKIVFQPFLNLGFVQQNKEVIKHIQFQNQGQKSGTLQFISNDPTLLSIQPAVLNIHPKMKNSLTIKYKPNQAGFFKGSIQIKSQQILAKNFIEVVATSLQKARFIVNPNKKSIQSPDFLFDFKTVYSGSKKVLKAFIINNSPNPMKFKTQLKKGNLQNSDQVGLNNTPFQQALQQKQKVFHLKPQNGTVQPFSQTEIQIICQSKVTYRQKTFVSTFALADFSQQGSIQAMKSAKNFKHQEYFEYTVILKSQEQKPLMMLLKANIACPQIKINKKALLFGDCLISQTKTQQIIVQNRNKQEKVSINFPKIPYFDFQPSKITLQSQRTKVIKVTFNPKTIGKIDQYQKILINQLFELNLRCMGIVRNNRSMSQKQLTGISQVSKVQQSPTKSFHTRRFSVTSGQKTMKTIQNQSHLNLITHKKLGSLGQFNLTLQNKKQTIFIQNKEKFSKLLTSRRVQRQKKQYQKEVQKQFSQLKEKIQKFKKNQTYDDQGLPQSSPIDYQFQIGSAKNLRQLEPKLQKKPSKLFVLKHIGDYEPQISLGAKNIAFLRTADDRPKRIFPQVPEIFNQRRQIQRDLSIEELQLIQVIQTKIYFGQTYIKSSTTKYFWIKNNTRFAISCRIFFKQSQLDKSHFKGQTIPPNQQAGFPIILTKNTIGQFFAEGYYIINEKYKYNLSASGKTVQVMLNLNKQNLPFNFPQTNLQSNTTENITITNPGNSQAKFKFTLTKEKYFVPSIMEGTVQPKQTINVPITFNLPVGYKNTKKTLQIKFQQKLSLKILDGEQKYLNCSYQMLEPKFTIKSELLNKKSAIFLNYELTDFLQIKNTGKQATVIHFQLLGGIQLTNSNNYKLRIMPQQTKKVKVKFVGSKEGDFKCEINLIPRGGTKKQNPLNIKVINPNIIFSNQDLHMDPLIVKSTKGQAFFTLIHKEQINVPLVFDFRPKKYNSKANPYIQFMDLKLLNQGIFLDTVATTLKSQEDQNIIDQNLCEKQIGIDDIQDHFSNQSFEDEQENLQKDQMELRRYKLQTKPNTEYKFKIQFIAPQILHYNIKLPIEIQKSIPLENSPTLQCQAIQPKFLFEPSNIDFKNKYLGKPDRSYPKIIEVLIKNENFEQVEWILDDKFLEKGNIFGFQCSKGTLKTQQGFKIKVTFNPFTVGQYQQKVPLMIKYKSQAKMIKFCDVFLKGTASIPQLFFNKRQAVMPVVPLGIETHTFFRILNDGYQNCNLTYDFEDDVAGIGVKVSFPEGNNIGISRSKLRVDLHWKFDRPMSFTLLLTFKDDMGKKFIIPVSGTTDNSILTNYMYFLRNQHHFKIKQQGALQLMQVKQNTTGTTLQRKHSAHSLKSNSTNRSIMSYLGVAPINPYILSTTLEYIVKYLNQNILTIPITQFPLSIIQNDGKPIFQVLSVTSGKNVKYQWMYQGNSKGQQRVKKLLNQYTQLVKMLKIQGALLNHIRPQYLLSFQDLNTYLSTLPPQKSKFYMPNLLKINSGLFNYLSTDSWITLLYQILKINLLSRISLKNIKDHIMFYKQKQIPNYYLEKSNFISISESILLHWCEEAYQEILLKDIRITNFDKDFKNGLIIGCLIQRYARNNLTAQMIIDPKSQEDQKKNAKLICQSLSEMGLLAHIQAKYIFNPFQRQMITLLTYLYINLPAYIPQQKPIVFQCILGQQIVKSIQLKNPSSKPLKYRAKYIGSPNYVLISEDVFTIQPKSTFDFKIKYVSRFVKQIKGRIAFIYVKDTTTGQGNNLSGSALVFDLKSQTVQIKSQKIWKVTSNLYQSSQFTVQIQNNINAPQNTEFQIKLKTQYLYDKKKNKKNNAEKLSPEQQVQVILLKNQTVKVKKGSIEPLTFTYIPLNMHKTRTLLLLSNDTIGQFQHQIQATPQQPALSAEIRPSMTLYSGQTYQWQYIVNPKNQMVLKAKKLYENLQTKKIKGGSPAKSKVKVANDQPQKRDEIINKRFQIQIDQNSFVNNIQSFVILSEQKKQKPNKKDTKQKGEQNAGIQNAQEKSLNNIKFKFTCKQPVYQYTTKFLVKDKKLIDVRRFRIIFTILPKPLSALLQMTTPARKQIIQNLPFINNTERDWNMKVSWNPGPGFTIPPNMASGFVIKRQSMCNLPVSFKPKWTQQSQAKLMVSNPLTLDQFQYQIKGYAQDPLAEGHIDIKCQINETVKRKVTLHNPYNQKAISLRVQTDIPNFSGQMKLTIPANGRLQYEFKVTPMVCGQFTSCITFFENQGPQYFWYTVFVATNATSAVKKFNIESQIRQRRTYKLQIPINFNMKKQEQFEVTLTGEGVIGPSKIKLYPKQTVKFQQKNVIPIQYLPLRVGTFTGSIYIVNPQVGQILVDLNLVCHPQHPIIGHLKKSYLGVGSTEQIVLQNPINSKVTVRYNNSNPQTFVVHNPSATDKNDKSNIIKLSPFQKKVIKVEYIPGSLQTIQKSQIIFYSQQIGEWQFHFSGIGIAPTQFDPLVLYRQIKCIDPSSIKFRNPFNYTITVGVKLIIEEQWNEVFKLNLLGNEIISLQAHGNIQIPFTFIPFQMMKYYCTIKVLLSEKIFWTFPIIGIAQKFMKQNLTHITVKCRQSSRIQKKIQLEGVQRYKNNNFYEIKLQNIPQQHKRQVQLFFSSELTKNSLLHQNDCLIAEYLFKPMKPFKTTFDIVIDRKDGGRWAYKMILEALPPVFDDRIQLESNLMTTSNVSFKITNWQKNSTQFKAYFTSDSAHQFSVQPQQGILSKYGGKGTQFYVSFTPVQYGKQKNGKLIIETSNMYWSYQIYGRLPKYVPPNRKSVSKLTK